MEKAFDSGDFIEPPGGTVTSYCGQYKKSIGQKYINTENKKTKNFVFLA